MKLLKNTYYQNSSKIKMLKGVFCLCFSTCRTASLLLVLQLTCLNFSTAQNNALVLNGALTILNGGTAATPVYMVVNQNNPLGIVRYNGHINSENQYNYIKWESGNSTGSFVFPLGVGSNTADYIPFTFNKTSSGASNVQLSTWATNNANLPHAATTNVNAVSSMTGNVDSVLFAIDRFWDIQSTATADLTFSYRGIENTTIAPTDTVKAQHWNGVSWDAPVGPGNLGLTTGIGTAGPFVGQNTFSPWILSIQPLCPAATISYAASSFCNNDAAPQQVILNGAGGGNYSVTPSGLTINLSTGAITPNTSTPGIYTVTYTLAASAGCAATSTSVNVIINPTASSNQSVQICQGDSIFIAGAYQSNAGIYIDTLTAQSKCDSIVITTLTVIPTELTQLSVSICQGDSIFIAGAYQLNSGIYNDTLTTINGCDSIIETSLSFYSLTITQQTTSICQGDSIFIAGAYQLNSGIYNDTLTTINGCDSIIETTLSFYPLTITQQTASICQGDSIFIAGAYQLNAGVYNDTLTTSNGCDSIIETTLSFYPLTITQQTTSICQGDSIFIAGAYQLNAGIYYDTLTNSNGCDSIIETSLTVTPIPLISIAPVSPVCFGSPLVLTATGNATGTINWYTNAAGTNSIGTGSPFITSTSLLGNITYYAGIVGVCSSNIDSVTVNIVGVTAAINASPENGIAPLTVNFGNNSSSGAGITYYWDFDNGNTSNVFEPSNTYLQSGNYTTTLIVTDGTCSDTATILITVIDDSAIIFPNVFTPNDDGVNDVFTIPGKNLIEVKVEIFNRWGELLYMWDAPKGSWDGRTAAGVKAPDGTYLFIINAKGIDGKEYTKQGTFLLIR